MCIDKYYIWLLSVSERREKASERKVSKRKSPLYIRCATPEPGKSDISFLFQLFSYLPPILAPRLKTKVAK